MSTAQGLAQNVPQSASQSSALVAASRATHTQVDIVRLIRSENADDRAVAAHKLCRVMERRPLNGREREAANALIRWLARDTAELVRRALAVTLRTSELLPHDVALQLANDVAGVALPILIHSPVLSDDDLIAVIRSGSSVRQVAVAKREALSEAVTTCLSDEAIEEAAVLAAANDNADFSPEALARMLDRFGTSEVVHNVLVHRSELPVIIAERLVGMVSSALKHHLVTCHQVRPETAVKLVEAAQERSYLDMADMSAVNREPGHLARHLHSLNKLTPSLLLRALGRGQIAFFEHAISELARVPHERSWLMIHDAGALGLRAIYDRAGLPSRLFQTFRIALDTYHAIRDEGGELGPLRLQERLIERFLTQMPFAPREDLIYLYERLDRDTEGRAWADYARPQMRQVA